MSARRPWQVERDRFGVMFSGPLEVGEMREVVPCDDQAVERGVLVLRALLGPVIGDDDELRAMARGVLMAAAQGEDWPG